MIVVIIAGGSGSRLWPLSTPDFPKQLLKLTNDKSMIQNTYERAKRLGNEIYIVPVKDIIDQVKEQLPQLDDEHIINEPARRGTANCIMAALAHIASRHDHDEPIAFVSTDHQIRDVQGFARSFKTAGEASKRHNTIALIGIEPTFPATGFGYIERDGEVESGISVYNVESFKEKPDFNTAKRYVASGRYLWNCGYFVGSVNAFVHAMETYAPVLKVNYDALLAAGDQTGKVYADTYLTFGNEVIDIALIEKTKDLVVVPASFDWVDLGSFKDLHEASETDESGNHLRGEGIYEDEVENAYIRNEENKPVVVIGLDNVVVINTPNGVLVARKDLSQKVKDAVKRIEENNR
jgi:mannose-1-phosphate guanylyltransferase